LAVFFTLLRSSPVDASPKAPDACITGTIHTNTTWNLAGSPYLVCNTSLTVGPTATLSIEPGVTVIFQAAPTNKLYFEGSLVAPGQTITVTVTILTGTPLPQNSLPSIAVEGWVGSKLVGGVVIQLDVPQYMPFDGTAKIFIPVVRK
jgi:hypothetical protein